MPIFAKHAKRKEQRKHIEHAVFQVKYARRMREDLISPEQCAELRALQKDLKAHLRAGELEEGVKLAEKGLKLAKKIHPAPKDKIALRENIEVFVVVMAVALGLRTYFLQPYQIPTGSMQPTLYGITSHVDYEADWTDRLPVKLGKFLITGGWYREVRAKADGVVPAWSTWKHSDTHVKIQIGGRQHRFHKDIVYDRFKESLQPGFPRPGTPVKKGDLLASGLTKRGDHIVVNRLITNFVPPRRGDIVVFHTGGLPAVRENSAYIKRLTGMPGESISIRDGYLYADGQKVTSPEVFVRQAEDPKYPGYSNPPLKAYQDYDLEPILAFEDQEFVLGEDEYLMMGDNTDNSLDGRYFGAVPGENVMGIGFLVPWPFVQRGIYGESAGLVR